MTRVEIPQSSRQYIQSNQGQVLSNITGNVKATYGVDSVTNFGKLRGNKRMYAVTDESTIEELAAGSPRILAIERPFASGDEGNRYAAIGTEQNSNTHGLIYQTTGGLDPTAAFDNEVELDGGSDGPLASAADAIIFNNKLYTVVKEDINEFQFEGGGNDIDWFTNVVGGSALQITDGDGNVVTHPLGRTQGGGNEFLLIADKHNEVYTVDESNNLDTPNAKFALSLDPEIQITKFVPTSNRVYILTRNKNGGDAFIYEWIVGNTGTNGNGLANRVYIIPAEGALSGVELNDVPYVMCSDGAIRALTSRGFEVVAALPTYYKQKELINSTQTFSNFRFIHPNGMDVEKGNIYMLLDTRLEGGGYDEDTPAGIWMYDPDRGSLEHHASLGIADGTDHGQAQISIAGALLATGKQKGRFLVGAAHFPTSSQVTYSKTSETDDAIDNTEDTGGIYVLDDVGSFDHVSRITYPQFHSSNVKDDWNAFALQYEKMSSAFDEIVVKWRQEEVDSVTAAISWTTANEFDVTADLSNFEVGDEVFITQGDNAGISAHITGLNNTSGNNYKVTLDESHGANNDSSRAVFENYKKHTSLSKLQAQVTNLPSKPEPWIQIRLELRGSGDRPEVDRLFMNSKTNQEI